MITWMQKHKKWLVITIWVSAIAFIGAGMVNWGSYSFSSSYGKVAEVGSLDITTSEYQRAYGNILNEFAQLPGMGGMLDEAQAKQFGLPKLALQQLIQQAQLLNFAHDLGLSVDDEEISKEIINAKVYVDKDGNFSREIYNQSLRDRQMSSVEFEEMLRKVLLVQKLLGVMNLNSQFATTSITPLEIETFKTTNSIFDHLKVKVIESSSITLNYTPQEFKTFWEQNTERWKTPMEFQVEYILVPYTDQNPSQNELTKHYEDFKSDYLDSDGQLMSIESSKAKLLFDVQKLMAESVAKRKYRALKEGDEQGKIQYLKEGQQFFIKKGIDLVIEDLKVAQVGQILKPIEVDEGYVTLKLLDKKESVNKSFEEAREEAKLAFEAQKYQEKLKEVAESNLPDFNGIDLGFIGVDYKGTIAGLDDTQTRQLLNQIFASTDKNGYILLGDKAVLYAIMNQKVQPSESGNLTIQTRNIKSEIVLQTLLEYLNKTYKTRLYVDL